MNSWRVDDAKTVKECYINVKLQAVLTRENSCFLPAVPLLISLLAFALNADANLFKYTLQDTLAIVRGLTLP